MAEFPRVCWVVAAVNPESAMERVRSLKPAAGKFVEARLDFLPHAEVQAPKLIRSMRLAKVKVLATLRTTIAGGRFAGPVEQQLAILARCKEAGADLIDVEIESIDTAGPAAVAKLRGPAKLVVSYHNYRETPDGLAAVLAAMKKIPADYYKVVTHASRHSECDQLLRLNGAVRGKPPVLAFGMGEVALATRILSVARGAPYTYGCFSSEEATAPGQVSGGDLLSRYRLDRISAKTAVYGVIGNPIAHSLSPVIHNAAFAAAKVDAVYLPFRVESLEDFLGAAAEYKLAGFSVTIPHKEAMASAADWLDAEAREAGAANTIVVKGGKRRGYNTDMAGIIVPLEKHIKLRGARVLVAGTGGAARAAAFALKRRKARVYVVGRRAEQAITVAEQVGVEPLDRSALVNEQFDAIVHCTPLGMYPDIDSCFFSPGELNAPLLLETVYNPVETKLVRLARSRRMKVIPGLEMFLEQAALQFELWTGRKAPRPVMEKAALAALGVKTRSR